MNYPDTATDEEIEFGFVSLEISTGYGSILGGPDTKTVIVKYYSDRDRIIKIGPDEFIFQFLLYGKDSEDLNSWYPVEDETYTLGRLRAEHGG
jgi:hypothetical protein